MKWNLKMLIFVSRELRYCGVARDMLAVPQPRRRWGRVIVDLRSSLSFYVRPLFECYPFANIRPLYGIDGNEGETSRST